ncbi:porin [Shimia sp. CNT1-13L.2]|uniref:porin n=1 Tax=Shimia sp. CNT1-13L.2 TaxID=2959663 RepID=UPI0020CFD9AE|nr:porin [Shimia sp. CNT1-13L.2]MCP9480918.1 porin [Shimia sp. CNT1-13L.2]
MKKVLFATTALVATAGVAAADVTFGGYGRFGVLYVDGAANEVTLSSRLRLIVTATAETDNGLSFGSQIRYQADADENGYSSNFAGNIAAFNTPRFWVSTGGLTLSVGNVLGALENMPGMYDGGVGFTGLGFLEAVYGGGDAYSSGGAGVFGVDVLYSAGAFGVHLSHSSDDLIGATVVDRTALAVSYTAGNYTVAAAIQDSDNAADTDFALTASGSFGAADVTVKYADNGTADSTFGLGVNYAVSDATTLAGYINRDSGIDQTAWGIGVRHSLGGGVSLRAGIVDNYAGVTSADAGVVFNF